MGGGATRSAGEAPGGVAGAAFPCPTGSRIKPIADKLRMRYANGSFIVVLAPGKSARVHFNLHHASLIEHKSKRIFLPHHTVEHDNRSSKRRVTPPGSVPRKDL